MYFVLSIKGQSHSIRMETSLYEEKPTIDSRSIISEYTNEVEYLLETFLSRPLGMEFLCLN